MANEEQAANLDRSVPHAYPKLVEAYLELVMIERRNWTGYKGPAGILEDALKLTSACPTGPKLEALKRVVAAFEEETAGCTEPLFRFNFPVASRALPVE